MCELTLHVLSNLFIIIFIILYRHIIIKNNKVKQKHTYKKISLYVLSIKSLF